jgi:hypothetical protein
MKLATKIVAIALAAIALCGVGIGTASAATPVDGLRGVSITNNATDSTTSVVAYHSYLTGLQSVSLPAFTCPGDYPWLIDQNLSPGRIVPPGVRVDEPGGIGVTIGNPSRDNDSRVNGWRSGSATNWSPSPQILTVSTVCTNNPVESYKA